MALVIGPRLCSQMRLSALRDTPDLLSRCHGANTLAVVCLSARPSRSVHVSSGSSHNEQTALAACYDQTTGCIGGRNPGVVQGWLPAYHPSAACQLPLQLGIYNQCFGPHGHPPKTAAAEPVAIRAEQLTPEWVLDRHIRYISYVRNYTQALQPLPRPSKSIPVMIGGELVDNLKETLKQLVPNAPILYTFTAHLPGADQKTLLYLGQSGQGLTRMLTYVQEDEDFFGDSQDSLKKAYMLDLAAGGATIELQFVEVPAPLEVEALEKEVLKAIDFCLNKIHNGQVRSPQLLAPMSEIITKHQDKASKAAQIRREIEARDARDMHSTDVEDMPNPVLRTLLINRFEQAAAEINKMCRDELKECWQQVSMGLQNSGSTFVIAMTDFRDECSPETISQYNKSELETMYYTHHGRLPRKMSKDRLLQVVLELSSGVAASGNDAAGCLDPVNNAQEGRVSAKPSSKDVLPAATTSNHPIRSTSSTTCPASGDSDIKSSQPGRRGRNASKAGGSSAGSAVNVSDRTSSEQQLMGGKDATSVGGMQLSTLPAPVLQGLVQMLCVSDAAKSKPLKKQCLVLLEDMLPKQGTKALATSSATVAMSSFLNKITPEYLKTATRPILDAFYYFSEGRMVTSKEMKVDQLRDFLLKKIDDKPSILSIPSMEAVPSTSQGVQTSKYRRQSRKTAANDYKKSLPTSSRSRTTSQSHQHWACI